MTKIILAIIDRFSWVLVRLDVDYIQFRTILRIKLTMDDRRVSFMAAEKIRKESHQMQFVLFVYAFMGIFLGMFIIQIQNPLLAFTLVHSFIMTMIALSLIADFTSVLIDTTENTILLPRPVSSRTLLVARIAHIVVYLSKITFFLSLVSVLTGIYKYGIFFTPIFLGTLLCSLMFVVFITCLFYLVAMHFMDGEKFRDIILYFQIAMTAVVFGGYQLMPRLMTVKSLKTITLDHYWWIFLYPPSWMAAPIDLLAGNRGTPQIILTILALTVPLITLGLVVKVMAPVFTRSLGLLETNAGSSAKTKGLKASRKNLNQLGSSIFTHNPTEKAGFEFVWNLCSRERHFKLSIYPSFVMLFIFSGVFLFQSEKGIFRTFLELPNTRYYFFILYFASFILSVLIDSIRYTPNYEASWIYYTLPMERTGDFLAGSMKSLLVRFVVPLFIFLSLVIFAIWGFSVITDVCIAFCFTLLTMTFNALTFGRTFPFSQKQSIYQKSGRIVGILFIAMILPGIFGLLHYFLLSTRSAYMIFTIPTVLFLSGLLFKRYQNTGIVMTP